jgi:hypothetical protein
MNRTAGILTFGILNSENCLGSFHFIYPDVLHIGALLLRRHLLPPALRFDLDKSVGKPVCVSALSFHILMAILHTGL